MVWSSLTVCCSFHHEELYGHKCSLHLACTKLLLFVFGLKYMILWEERSSLISRISDGNLYMWFFYFWKETVYVAFKNH